MAPLRHQYFSNENISKIIYGQNDNIVAVNGAQIVVSRASEQPPRSTKSPAKAGRLAGANPKAAAAGAAKKPLAKKSLWVITDGKAAMEVQCVGVARALGIEPELKRVAPGWLWHLLAPWGPPDPADRFGSPGTAFAAPWPDIAIATGRQSIPYLRALRRAAGPATYTVVIQNPRTGSATADLICVPKHDGMSGKNVVITLTAPHGFSPALLAKLRKKPAPEITAMPRPRTMIALGGPNAVYRFTDADKACLARAVSSLAELGSSFLITPSRRTPADLIAAVAEAAPADRRLVWDGKGENPYELYLAHADQLIVTADSVNMVGEACATGRPVYVFTPHGGSAKFAWFHASLRQYGATRALPDVFSGLESWSYAPLDSSAEIAREIERRLLERQEAAG